MMGLDDALIFTRVVECHSFTLAAKGLGMQKSTVSRRLALLEDRLGVRLLNRTTRKLRLTEVGQAYYERCRQIMLDFAEAEQAVMQLQHEPSGLLRISSPIEFGQMFLAQAIGAFMRQYPQITAEVELTARYVDPVEEGVDIVLLIGQPQDSTLIARKLLETRRSLYASPEYLALHGEPSAVSDLVGHRAIHLINDPPRYWPLTGHSIASQSVMTCNNVTFAREAVLAGAGIGGLPDMICTEAVAQGRLVNVLSGVELPSGELYAIYPSRRFQAMKVKTFLDFLIQALQDLGGFELEPKAFGLLISQP